MNEKQKKSNLLDIELKETKKFEEKIQQIYIKEFEDRVITILTFKPIEFMDLYSKRIVGIIEETYGSEALDNLNLTNIMKKMQGQIYEKFYLPTFQLLDKTLKDFEKDFRKSFDNNNSPFLTNFKKHCKNQSEDIAIHVCKGKLISVSSTYVRGNGVNSSSKSKKVTHLICVDCKKTYFSNSFTLLCECCGIEYNSHVLDQNQSSELVPATWDKYHCGALVNSAMNCIRCKSTFYLNTKINKLFCKSCSFETDPSLLVWVCFSCKGEFRSGAKAYNPQEFEEIKKAVKDALVLKKRAFPRKVPCCVLDSSIVFLHKKECEGRLYEGECNSKKVIVCDKCQVMNYESTFTWTCPNCLKLFSDTTNHLQVGSRHEKISLVKSPVNVHNRNSSFNRSVQDLDQENEANPINKKGIKHGVPGTNFMNQKNMNVNHLVSPVKHFLKNSPREIIQLKSTENEKNDVKVPSEEYHSNNNPANNNQNKFQKKFSLNYIQKSPLKNQVIGEIKSPEKFIKEKSQSSPHLEVNGSPIKLQKDIGKVNSPYKAHDKNMKISFSEKEKNNYHSNSDPKYNFSNDYSSNNNGNIISISINNVNIITNSNLGQKNDSLNRSPIKSHTEEPLNSKDFNLSDNSDPGKLRTFNHEEYKIIKKIGEGSYAQCYQVVDKQGKLFAMKKVIGNNEADIQGYIDELKLVNLHRHPHIMKILGFSRKKLDETTLALFVLMELASSDWDSEIKAKIQTKKYYTENELIEIVLQISKALSFLQKSSVAHRDIKPQNILVFENGVYKVADFGEAKEIKVSKQINSTLRGTELYMSPLLFNALRNGKEESNHNPYKSDVFSLAFCLIYAATLTYAPIYELRKVYDSTTMLWVLNKYLSGKFTSKFISLLMKMLEIKEENRFDFVDLESYINKNFK